MAADKSPRDIAESKGEVSGEGRKSPGAYCGVCGLPKDHPQEDHDHEEHMTELKLGSIVGEPLPAKGMKKE